MNCRAPLGVFICVLVAVAVGQTNINVYASGPGGLITYPYAVNTTYYPPSTYVSWTFYGAQRLFFSFLSMNIQRGDRLTLFNGVSSGSVIADFVNSYGPPANMYSSATSSVVMNFTTDSRFDGSGFVMHWGTVPNGPCRTGPYTPTESVISSMNVTDGYNRAEKYRTCTWLLRAAAGQLVSLKFTYFSLYYVDTIVLYDGTSTAAPVINTFTGGTTPPPPQSSTGDAMTVVYTTQYGAMFGFNATWGSFAPVADCAPSSTPGGSSGVISAPSTYDGVSRYTRGGSCTWALVAGGSSSRIRLVFGAVSLPAGVDAVFVYDGVDDTAPLLANVSGLSVPAAPVFSTDKNMFVVFSAAAGAVLLPYHGFQATWTAVTFMPCDAVNMPVVAGSGSFAFPVGGGAGNLGNTCLWSATASGAPRITLTVPQVHLGPGDVLTLYDGPDTSSPVIASYISITTPASTFVTTQTRAAMQLVLAQEAIVPDFSIAWVAGSDVAHCLPVANVNANSGVISEPIPFGFPNNYLPSMKCDWVIQVSFGIVRLNVTQLSLGSGDRVRIYNGVTRSSQLVGDIPAGVALPTQPFYSTNRFMLMTFESDWKSDTGLGFQATWTAYSPSYCGFNFENVFYANSTTQLFKYPADPNNDGVLYQTGASCYFRFVAPPGYVAYISHVFVDLETNVDYLKIYNGSVTPSQLMQTVTGTQLSGANLPLPVASLGTDLVVYFTSDSQTCYTGFSFNYTILPMPTQCSGGPTAVTVDTPTFFREIGAPLPYNDGFRYLANSDCYWLLTTVNPTDRVYIWFDKLSTFDDADNITIFDGSSTASPIVNALRSDLTRNLFNVGQSYFASSTNTMLVWFHSDATNQGRGFHATMLASPGPSVCSNTVTNVTNSQLPVWFGNNIPFGAGYYYLPNTSCTWSIAPSFTWSQRIVVTFPNIRIGAGDALTIYDGDSINSPVITTYGASWVPRPIIGFSGQIFARLKSDGALNNYGFEGIVAETNVTGQCLEQTISRNEAGGTIQTPIPWDGVALITAQLLCRWSIQVNNSYDQIILTVKTLSIATSMATTVFAYSTNLGNLPLVSPGATPLQFAIPSRDATVQQTTGNNLNIGVNIEWSAIKVSKCTGGSLTGTSGTFSSHYPADGVTVYPTNSNCAWLITIDPPYTQIRLYLDFVQTTGTTDAVTIYNGANSSYPVLFKSSINGYYGGYVSTGLSMYVTFVSDGIPSGWSGTGFSARWEAGTLPTSCFGVVQQMGSGDIENPIPWDGANKYSPGAICNWLLTPAAGYDSVVVYFEYIQNDVNDYLFLYDGATVNAPKIGSFNAGPLLPRASSGPSMLLSFTSTAQSYRSYGFKLNWTSALLPPACDAMNFPPSDYGTLSYPPPWGSGFRYQSGLDCLFLLQVTDGTRVQMNMKELCLTTGDTLTIYDGYHVKAPQITQFVGNKASYSVGAFTRTFVSSTSYMLVRFTTQLLSVPNLGFSMDYTSTTTTPSLPDSANLPIYDCDYSGSLMAPDPFTTAGIPSYNTKPGYWLYTAKQGFAKLQFYLEIAKVGGTSGGLFVIYNGNTTSAPTLIYVQCCSATSPRTVNTTGSQALVYFTPNTGGYFKLNWTAIEPTGDPLNTNCPLIPIPVAPVATTSTTGEDAVVAPAAGLTTTTIALISFFSIFAVILIVAAVLAVLYLRKKKRDREQYGDSTVRLDIGPDAVMRKRVNTLLKQSTTKQIGKGGTAVVFKVSMEDNTMVAMKQLMDSTEASKVEFHKEVTIFSRLTGKEHPNVLRLILFCNDPPVIVCELAEKGSLHRMRKEFPSMPVPQKKAVLIQVSEGMRFLHENDIVHLDLKPENVLVGENGVLKISDFGTSLILGQDCQVDGMGLTVVNTFTGTPQYSAPERFTYGKPVDLKRCDVFSFGVMAWTVVTGEMPFDGETGETVMNMHLTSAFNADVRLPLPAGTDEVIADVIRRSILTDFTLRPIFFDIVSTLRSDDLSAVPTMNYSVGSGRDRQPSFGNAPLHSITHNAAFEGPGNRSSYNSDLGSQGFPSQGFASQAAGRRSGYETGNQKAAATAAPSAATTTTPAPAPNGRKSTTDKLNPFKSTNNNRASTTSLMSQRTVIDDQPSNSSSSTDSSDNEKPPPPSQPPPPESAAPAAPAPAAPAPAAPTTPRPTSTPPSATPPTPGGAPAAKVNPFAKKAPQA